MIRELTLLWHSLDDAEYLHLLLEPLPLFGLGFGLIALSIGMIVREWRMRVLALVVVIVSCLSVQPYVKLRVKSEPRVIALQDPAFHALIRQQTERRSNTTWIYYGAALFGVGALFYTRGGKGTIVNGLTIAVCCAAFLHALWLHKKECEVYHRNIVKYAPVR
jgi:hypothetical protein